MLERTKELYEEMDKMMEFCMKKAFSLDSLKYMSAEEIEMMQRCFTLYRQAQELAIKQAEIIDNQDRKLDMILSKLSKMESESL